MQLIPEDIPDEDLLTAPEEDEFSDAELEDGAEMLVEALTFG